MGGAASAGLGDLLTNRFSVPGSEAERGADLLEDRLGEGGGFYTLVFEATSGSARDPAFRREARRAAVRAASAVEGARSGPVTVASKHVAYAQVSTPLDWTDAADKTPDVRDALGTVPGTRTYVSGYPAINHDTDPIYEEDLARGESIAIPIALLVMAFMFGTLGGMAVPVVFALFTIPTTLGIVWIFANFLSMPVYVQNMATLIGLAIAIDYSMLVVYRYREELERGGGPHEALVRTMSTAGRATMFSGLVVAVGLALLVFMPLPFMRAMGLGGLLVPLVSLVAAATLLPALLAVMGTGVNRFRFVPRGLLAKRARGESGAWARLARSIMRRPVPYLVATVGLMLALAFPATQLQLTGGDARSLPEDTEATRGLAVLEDTLGPGSLSPHQLVVDTGRADGAWSAESVAAQRRLIASLRDDSEVEAQTIQAPALLVRAAGPPPPAVQARARAAGLVDGEGRLVQVRVAGRSDIGTEAAKDLVDRIRDDHVPAARFPSSAGVLLSGPAAYNVDFIDTAYAAFPWLVLAVLVLSYLLLLRAFRSLLLPAKAVLMNLLSVAATYGVLVLIFQHELGEAAGFTGSPQIESWIPIFLFAILFGLSMDYEVFLLSRMREEWDRSHDNERAVALGLERTGRIITAAAIIMIAAFSGFIAGSFVWSQEFGVGLSAAILLDATIVRAMLVPAAMKLLGEWNWYLPDRVRRVLRLGRPSGPATAGAE
jgi:RND superfamily putative drug exporter